MAYRNEEDAKAAKRRWYENNKALQLQRQAIRQQKLLEWLKTYKRTLACADCGFSFSSHPECLDFHHLDPSIKDGVVSRFSSYGKTKMVNEIKKCIPLCANCHRIRHG